MTDYIKRKDAARVMAILMAAEAEADGYPDAHIDNYIEYALEDLEDIPSADVAPVRHGRWAETVTDGFLFVSCSACGFKTGRIDYNYCPNCGAKMDLEG